MSYPPQQIKYSYQSGSIPPPLYGEPNQSDIESGEGGIAVGAWETRFGWRVDVEAALAYALGPITALLLLIFETTSDYIRYHAYQSALLSVFLTSVHLVLLILHFPSFFNWCAILFDTFILGKTALHAYNDAQSLERYPLPYLGDIANRWVGEE